MRRQKFELELKGVKTALDGRDIQIKLKLKDVKTALDGRDIPHLVHIYIKNKNRDLQT